MKAAGFSDYSQFIKAVFGGDPAARRGQASWLPVYWNLGDEPIGDDLRRAAENAEAYRAAFPSGPPWFTAATSLSTRSRRGRPALPLRQGPARGQPQWARRGGRAELLHAAGSDWAFYNGGNRWTYGVYLYKAAKQFGMKFRLTWHWNATAGDPYYALDCREDDYAWCNSQSRRRADPFGLLRARDARRAGRLPPPADALPAGRRESTTRRPKSLIQKRLDAFQLGQRDHDPLFPPSDWREFRLKMATAIERLQ